MFYIQSSLVKSLALPMDPWVLPGVISKHRFKSILSSARCGFKIKKGEKKEQEQKDNLGQAAPCSVPPGSSTYCIILFEVLCTLPIKLSSMMDSDDVLTRYCEWELPVHDCQHLLSFMFCQLLR